MAQRSLLPPLHFPSYGAVGNIIAGWSTATVGQTTYGAGTSVAGSALRVHPAIPLTASTAPNLSGVINPGLGGTWVACNRFVGNDGYGSAYNTLWMRIS